MEVLFSRISARLSLKSGCVIQDNTDKKKHTKKSEVSLLRIQLVESHVVLDGDSRSRVGKVGIAAGHDTESLSLRFPCESGNRV